MSKKKKTKNTTENGNDLLSDVIDLLELNGDGEFCFSCKKNEMFLIDNELVYECKNCGHWEYSSS